MQGSECVCCCSLARSPPCFMRLWSRRRRFAQVAQPELRPSKTAANTVFDIHRTSYSVSTEATHRVDWLVRKAHRLTGIPISHYESPQIARYLGGQCVRRRVVVFRRRRCRCWWWCLSLPRRWLFAVLRRRAIELQASCPQVLPGSRRRFFGALCARTLSSRVRWPALCNRSDVSQRR